TAPTTAAGVLTVGRAFAVNSGTTFTAGSFSHTVGGNFSAAGSFNAQTSTFTLNGAGAQSIGAATFNNLATSTGGVKTATGAIVVNGTVNVGSSTTFAAANFSHTFTGDFTNSGTVTNTTGASYAFAGNFTN